MKPEIEQAFQGKDIQNYTYPLKFIDMDRTLWFTTCMLKFCLSLLVFTESN